MRRIFLLLFAFFLGWNVSAVLGGELPEGISCPVTAEPVDPEIHRSYRDGKVYFCCDKCAEAFEADQSEFTMAANHQLVETGQYRQKACPITGKATKKGFTSDVDGMSIGMCCPFCKKKVDAASDTEKRELVFADEAFDQGFEHVPSDEGGEH